MHGRAHVFADNAGREACGALLNEKAIDGEAVLVGQGAHADHLAPQGPPWPY